MSKKYNDSNGIGIISVFIFLLLGVFIGIFFTKVFQHDVDEDIYILREDGYQYISPLLDTDFNPQTNRSDLLTLRSEIDDFILDNKAKGNISDIAVYYKDLNTGAWIGVDEKEDYTPASMLKVALMITYFKLAESDSSILERELYFERSEDYIEQNIPVDMVLESGYSYTVMDLIERMIVYSDNESLYLLSEELDTVNAKKIFEDLAIEIPSDDTVEDFISAKEYAGFFRILYNSSYLNREYSSMALNMLARATFDKGLRASIPLEIEIAHKFGERGYVESNKKQMHDCGIVYYPANPYILCIMTRGSNFERLEYVIQGVSNIVYRSIED